MRTGARTPEPAPISSSYASLDLYPYARSPSPIAPLIMGTPCSIMPEPYISDVIMWNEPMSTDYQDVVDHNTNWAYVPSYPLCANIVLINPSTAEQAVDSRIKACICRIKNDSNTTDLFTECIKCKHKDEDNGTIKWLIDSGASMAFTSIVSDFSNLIYYKPNRRPVVLTANDRAHILGFGSVFIQTTQRGNQRITRIHPVFYLPNMSERLLSMGQLLHGNLRVHSDQNTLTFEDAESKEIVLQANSSLIHPNLFWVDSQIVSGTALTAFSTIHADDYETWHRRLGHPSDQVLIKFKTKTKNLPSDLFIPKELPICKGCTQGKMRSCSFPENLHRAIKPFQRIHSDLREYPTLSYSKYKYFITFLDDCTSIAWITLLRSKKAEACKATKQFITMIKTQYNVSVMEWFSDNGGEYVDAQYIDLLKD